MASNFYINFSVAKLIERNSDPVGLDSGISPGIGSGTGFHSSRSGQSNYQKKESTGLQLKPEGLGKIGEFLSSLRADVENEIVNSGAAITNAGDLEVPGCFVDYSQEGIYGRIEISGQLRERNYYSLTATLSETSTNKESPFRALHGKGRQPTGTHYVVPCLAEGRRAPAQDLLTIGQRIIRESVKNIGQQLLADQSRSRSLMPNLEYAEVYVWSTLPAEIKQRWKEAFGEEFEVPAEYERFEKVYFLNEVALRMYQEAGEHLEVLKTIPAEEVPNLLGPALSGPYLAKPA
jgi:hypothetical protein